MASPVDNIKMFVNNRQAIICVTLSSVYYNRFGALLLVVRPRNGPIRSYINKIMKLIRFTYGPVKIS